MSKRIIFFLLIILNLVSGEELKIPQFNKEIPQTRKIILLNDNWIYEVDGKTHKANVPIFLEDKNVTLRKRFRLENKSDVYIYYLSFRRINGLQEIYFNDERIPFDPIDIEKLSFRIPSNIVKDDGENFIKLILSKKLKYKEQNVLASKIELAEKNFGIVGDVLFEILPSISFTDLSVMPSLDENFLTGIVNYKFELSSFKHIQPDSVKKLTVQIEVVDNQNLTVVNSIQEEIQFKGNSISFSGNLFIKNPNLWSISNQSFYTIRLKLYRDNTFVDEISSHIAFKRIGIKDSKIFLNNKPLVIRGLTYFETDKKDKYNFQDGIYKRDISLIKELNANAIFVKNSLPSYELISECEKNGILVFVDLDSKIYPSKYYQRYLSSKKRKLNFIISEYSKFGCFAGVNLGDIGKGESSSWINSLKNIRDSLNSNILIFAESYELRDQNLNSVDFIAYNVLHKSFSEVEKFIKEFNDEKFSLISSVGYNHGINEKEGYLNPYSAEAQAKYLSDVLEILLEKNISFSVHTFADYRLPYHSIIAGKYDNRLMKFGLVNEFRDKKKLSFQVFKNYMNESKLPLIMQGNYTESATMIFIVSGLLFLALTIITINSTHRFRENVSRAVLKTYNFFSDIRDGWFISSFHSMILALIVALSSSLTYSSLVYYWKDNIAFEKFISLFNSNLLFEFFSYVAWRPIELIFYFTLITLFIMILLTVSIKFFNLFVKNKIFFNHAFLILIWSAIPYLILIPLGMVAFKILSQHKYNLLIYLIIFLFHLWVLVRILKGISIVFEVKKIRVYSVAVLFLLAVFAGLILYLQVNYSSLDYFMEFFG